MIKYFSVFSFTLAAFGLFVIFSSTSKEGSEVAKSSTPEELDRLPQVITSADLDHAFNFAGEALPMENFDVRERLDRELLRSAYWHSNTLLNIKRTTRYFPIIEQILAEEGLPNDFKFLAVAESDLSNAVSPAGAKGVWQFLKGTGQEYGLEVNSEVDERYHLEKATRAACKYLKKYHQKFGSWTMAAAAYNVGASRLSKESEVQRGNSYYDLNLNQETARYVFRIVALKEILQHPEKFGFQLAEGEGYQPLPDYYTVEVKGAVENWGDFAQKYGISYRMLKVYNPWLVSHKLTNARKKTYEVRVPKK